MPEPGRYYNDAKTIAIRRGMPLDQERRHLWHEIVHALRGDANCQGLGSTAREHSVEREAARRAMPHELLTAALAASVDWWDLTARLKVPEPWVRFRVLIAHPLEREALEAALRWNTTAEGLRAKA